MGERTEPRATGRRLFATRDFLLLWTGETASAVGNSVTMVAIPLIAVVTLSPFEVGLLAASAWLHWTLIGLQVGAWVDRLARRPVMIICDLVSLTAFVSVPIAWWLGSLTFAHLLATSFVAGTAAVFFATAYHVYIPALLNKSELIDGNAKLQGSESAAQVVGPGLAGLIAQWLGAVVALLVDAVSFLVSAVCLLNIRTREHRPARIERAETLRQEIGAGLRFVIHDPYLRSIVLYSAVANLALDGYAAVQVVFLVRTLDVNAAGVGTLLALISLGGVVGALIVEPFARRFGTARGMLIRQFVAAPIGLLMPLANPGAGLILFVAGGFVVLASLVATNITLNSFRQSYCPPELLGRVVATTLFINYSTIPVAALIGRALGSALGPRPTMWIMTGLFVLSGFIMLVGPISTVRDLPTTVGAGADEELTA